MSVFSSSINHRSFYWQISMLCFVLGILLAAAWHTTTSISRSGNSNPRIGFSFQSPINLTAKNEAENKKNRERISELENALAHQGDAGKTLNKSLQDMKDLLAITEVEGNGVVVTLNDSPKQPINPADQINQNHLIHDFDVANVVNELKAAGAEAISINGQRVGFTSAIRCVGPVIHVNGQGVAPPITIQAIGNPDTIAGGLDMLGGILEKIRRYDPVMARIEKRAKMRLPAFSGSIQFQYAKPIRPKESSQKESTK
ncbi:hypothetical protein LBMAG21_01300 [Armatimonadota bacterium]|nr:hypothetical protein LBMAG21_01300 [Armatimonadota bacterium]